MQSKGIVFDIQRCSIHDGPGIRTNIFLKGCPLRCRWCHNPEGLSHAIEISYLEKKCVLCGNCVSVCEKGCHKIDKTGHIFDRTECTSCGKCADSCFFLALEAVGREMTPETVIKEALKDSAFFQASKGGITLSGGEPMFQPDFAKEILSLAKSNGLSSCMETSGFCSKQSLISVINFTDLFLFDIKETDRARHIAYTGVDNTPILENLKLLSDAGKNIVLRCPLIPNINDREEHAKEIANLSRTHNGVVKIEVEPYHPLGISKSARFGKTPLYHRETFMKKSDAEAFADIIKKHTDVPVEVK